AYCGYFSCILPGTDEVAQDTVFLRQIPSVAGPNAPVWANESVVGDFYRVLFYLGDRARPIQNLTYLRDQRIRVPELCVVTRAKDAPRLAQLGTVQLLLQSSHARWETSPGDRLTLFRVRFYPNLARYPAPAHISPMQAMLREKGPYCGP